MDNAVQAETEEKNYTPERKTEAPEVKQDTETEVFDRKRLFPKSRNLPPTSAIIRRRLRPKKVEGTPATETKTNNYGKNEVVPGSLLPAGFGDKLEIISPTILIDEFKTKASREEDDGDLEEPNYPKITIPRFRELKKKAEEEALRNQTLIESLSKSQENSSPMAKNITPTVESIKITVESEKPTIGSEIPTVESGNPMVESQKPTVESEKLTIESQKPTVESQKPTVESESSVTWEMVTEMGQINSTADDEDTANYKSITVRTDETLKYEALDIPNVRDEILDLLKSETGSSRLARILEIRNMTLIELIEHRERGSSQLHLSDIFKRSRKTTKKPETVVEAKDSSTSTTPLKAQPITFPNDEIMGSFPSFVSEKIDIKKQENEDRETLNSREEDKPVEVREPRNYEKGEKSPPYATWKVIPNPRLTPVSVRGQYEEIYLSKYQSTDKPSQEANEIVLLGEYDRPILHRNEIGGQLSAESVRIKNGDHTSFRRIPPGMKSAIIVSGAILVMAIFGFLSVLISCRVRQRRARLRAKRDILCEHLQNEDFMNSQRSLSPVLTKTQREPVFTQGIHSNTTSNRHYYLWRTLRKTFQYD
jgi:hypothetical protein